MASRSEDAFVSEEEFLAHAIVTKEGLLTQSHLYIAIIVILYEKMGLLIPAKVLSSNTHGRGLFADSDLPAGTVVWRFDPKVDKAVSSQEAGRSVYWRFDNFAYYDKNVKKWIYHLDKTKWINHSHKPNLKNRGTETITNRHVKRGEELLEDYCEASARCKQGKTFDNKVNQ